MGYAQFHAQLKKINLKPKGIKEIVLEISDRALDGKIDGLSEMIDGKVQITIDSQVVRYNIQVNAQTNKPLKTYKVDEQGVVSEVKPEGEQAELDLRLPKEQVPTAEQQEEADRLVIDEFICSGLAPQHEDLQIDFQTMVKRFLEDESYSKLASELGMSSGKIVEIIDEYRSRVAPLAVKWDEWRKGQATAGSKEEASAGPETSQEAAGEASKETAKQQEDDDLPDWAKDNSSEDTSDPEDKSEPSDLGSDEIEKFILQERPKFDDMEYDFAELLRRRREDGVSWMEIARELGIPSSSLQGKWHLYKKRVTKLIEDNNAA